MQRGNNPESWIPLGRGRKIGLEIELVHPNGCEIVDTFHLEIGSFPNPEYVAALKYDGSVAGGEFVTQPATLPVHRANLPELQRQLRAAAFSANASCGLHVHVARLREGEDNRSPKANAIFRLGNYPTPEWNRLSVAVMGRGGAHYARVPGTDSDILATPELMTGTGGYWQEKFTRVNFMHVNSIEFRQGHGTLRRSRILRRAEFALAVCEWAESGAVNFTVSGLDAVSVFQGFVTRSADRFPALSRFLSDYVDASESSGLEDPEADAA